MAQDFTQSFPAMERTTSVKKSEFLAKIQGGLVKKREKASFRRSELKNQPESDDASQQALPTCQQQT